MVVLGIPPTSRIPALATSKEAASRSKPRVPGYGVRRIHEKPELKLAQEYVAPETTTGMQGFFWRVSTFLENLKRFLPKTHTALEKLAEFIGTRSYERKLRAIYPKLEIFPWIRRALSPPNSVEGPSRVFVIPPSRLSDIGSWAASISYCKE